jgi:hypothetical protein
MPKKSATDNRPEVETKIEPVAQPAPTTEVERIYQRGCEVLGLAREERIPVATATKKWAAAHDTSWDSARKWAKFADCYPDGLPPWLAALGHLRDAHIRRIHKAGVPPAERPGLLVKANDARLGRDDLEALIEAITGPTTATGGPKPKASRAGTAGLIRQTGEPVRRLLIGIEPGGALHTAWAKEPPCRDRATRERLAVLREALIRIAEAALRLDGRLAELLGQVADLGQAVAALEAARAARSRKKRHVKS